MSENPKRLTKLYSISIISGMNALFKDSMSSKITLVFLTKH